jgi:hypothetical protein
VSKGVPVLLATTIFVLQEGGNYKQFHRGDAVPGLNEEQIERLTKHGALGTADDIEPDGVEVGADDVERNGMGVPVSDPDVGSDKPADDANKPDLVEWVYENVAKPDGSDYTKSELNRMNKDELVDLINSVED